MKRSAWLSLLRAAIVAGALSVTLLPAAPTAAAPEPAPAQSLAAALLPATTYTYDDAPAAPVIIDNKTTCDGREVVRTFSVAESFTVVDVRLGFNATHTYRGDLRVSLQSPAGTRVELINASTRNSWANYDLLLSDATTNPINDLNNDDPLAPFYERVARPRNPFSAFSGQNSAGAWTLAICDAEPSGDDGLYNRSQLLLDGQPAGVALRASVTADRLKVAQGMAITYHLAVQNVGLADAAGVTLTDPLPSGTSFLASSLHTEGSPPAVVDSSRVTWTGAVGSGQSTGVTYQVIVTSPSGTLTGAATITHASLPTPLRPSVASQVFAGQDRLVTDETDCAIPDNGCPSNAATSTIEIGESFIVTGLRVGLSLDHTYRGDLSATLRSPAGVRVDLIAADPDDYRENYDILLDSASGKLLNDGTNDSLALPFYDRSVAAVQSLAAFTGDNAAGTWTLSVCDADPVDDGVLRQWSLFFDTTTPPAAPVVSISTAGVAGADVRLDWILVDGANAYRVWRGDRPGFQPGPTPDQDDEATSYIDPGALTGSANTYYVVRAVPAGGVESGDSNRTGKFTFALVAGSGP